MNRVAIIENSNGLGAFFTRYLDKSEYTLFPAWKTSQLPDEEFDAYIFTGDFNNISDGLLPIHEKEIEFVKSIKGKKIFASCFFHQLMGVIFGSTIEKREERFFGWHKIDIKEMHQILNGLTGKDPYFLSLNGDEITQMPQTAQILATNPDCIYQMLQYGEPIITCQCHPEIFKQDALELIETHKDGLKDRCSNLEDLLRKTKQYADDKSNKIFLSNMTEWLLS